MMLLSFLIFTVALAFCVAKLEINTEGTSPWAKNLPTYKFYNILSSFFIGETPMTGYHLWLNNTIILFAHFPFFIGIPWSLALELRIIGFFLLGAALEDFFWFVFNPAYGIKKFNKHSGVWMRWVGFIPLLDLTYLIISAVLISISIILS